MSWKTIFRFTGWALLIGIALLGLAAAVAQHWIRLDREAARAGVSNPPPPRTASAQIPWRDPSQVVPVAEDGGRDALMALGEEKDWLRTGTAAELLARGKIKAAIPALEKLAAQHWYKPVRLTAHQAIAVLKGVEATPSAPLSWVMRFWLDEFQTWQATQTPKAPKVSEVDYLFGDHVRDFYEWLADARQACFWRMQPRVERVEIRFKDQPPVVESLTPNGKLMRPRQAIAFGDGKLLGYNEGEFGAGVVYARDDRLPVYFDTDNVEAFVQMPFGTLVLCSRAMIGGGTVYLARQQANGDVTVEFFQRLPDEPYRFQKHASGVLILWCGANYVAITSEGVLRLADTAEQATLN